MWSCGRTALAPDGGGTLGLDLGEVPFGRSRRFRGGWTLQGLLAPASGEFYAGDWAEIGTKRSLKKELNIMTGDRGAPFGGRTAAHLSRCQANVLSNRKRHHSIRGLGLLSAGYLPG
ncbi:hypothetical protein JX265_011089 [Neoarthrinium moseri]|uniref:Uncharacterized protein n=1 Tax=Neoarthrinium moseri TaxID=1658444 RepID=A0A9P9WCW4_9PEZI|nr:hypothetical protein JX265_011089 [Neoarthrinium moseri]